MKQLDLITGFLGSGKTTFLIEYARQRMAAGEKGAIIVNDYGAINVDRLLILEALSEDVTVEMVIGGDADCHRRRLKTKLITMGMEDADRVIVEPSGIFDAEDFLNLLYEDPLQRMYHMSNIFCVTDASVQKEPWSKESRYLLAVQASMAGKVIISKPASGDADAAIRFLNNCLEEFGSAERIEDGLLWEKGKLSAEEVESLITAGYHPLEMKRLPVVAEGHFQSLFFMHARLEKDRIEETMAKMFGDSSLGHIVRIKGYLPKGDAWTEINATSVRTEITTSTYGQEVILVLGEDLDKERIGACFDSFENA